MKAGWSTIRLGSVASVVAGQSPDGSHYNDAGLGLPFYQGKKEFTDRVIGEATTWTTETTRIAEPGDILMSVRAPVGPVNLNRAASCIGRGLAAIRPSGRVDRDFLFYQLRRLEPTIAGRQGAVFASISRTDIEALEIQLPSLEDQRRIVAKLDDLVSSIEAAMGFEASKLGKAKDLFRSKLDAVFSSAWRTHPIVPLADTAMSITDGDHLPPPKAARGVPFITISNIDKETRRIDFSDTFLVREDYFRGLHQARRPLRGDVLYTVTGSFGIPVLVETDEPFCFQRHIALIRPRADIDSSWLAYAMLSPQVFAQAMTRSTGAAQRTVSLKELRSFRVPRVPNVEQRRVAAELDVVSFGIRDLRQAIRRRQALIQELKMSLLHQAFTGAL